MNFIKLGESFSEVDKLQGPIKNIYEALLKNKAYEFIELQAIKDNQPSIIVDLACESIPSRNLIGIKTRERLAITFIKRNPGLIPFEVFPLRLDFPDTLHLNNSRVGFPRSFCLYLDPWKEIEREFTPEKFLKRIEEWLLLTSINNLHQDDQPLEQLYFHSQYELLLPAEYQMKLNKQEEILSLKSLITDKDTNKHILTTEFRNQSYETPKSIINFLYIDVPPVKHSGVSNVPNSLGELEQQFNNRGSGIIDSLKKEIHELVGPDGINEDLKNNFIILLVSIPRLNNAGSDEGDINLWSFFLDCNLGKLGEKLGVLNPKFNGRHFRTFSISQSEESFIEEWKEIEVQPIPVVESLTKSFAQTLSNIGEAASNFNGALLGAGALGSSMADNWSRNAWGSWLVLDGDEIKIHNLIRHTAKFTDLARSKARVVSESMNANFEEGYANNKYLFCELSLENSNEWIDSIKECELVVDTTATKYLLKDLSSIDDIPRSASIFLSPSGANSIMLLEDSERNIRLDYLEMLYYRSIINEIWGEDFLKTQEGLRVGTSCSDISSTISIEQIKLHSSLLSQQLRLKKGDNKASVMAWKLNDFTGGVESCKIEISSPIVKKIKDWKVIIDEHTISNLYRIRKENLPNETGGILIGYVDQKLKSIYIVDFLLAPNDSVSSPNGFTRGTVGLSEKLTNIMERTNHIVDYIGEWHSHPKGASAKPSDIDLQQMSQFIEIMAADGLHHIMLIVGENEIGYILAEAD
ncbi:Mov34/MPN/PAD-1 family protein [Leptospira santarosai]|uniref:Mov34/MPN/PAD-1 family protein n=1 Tax=Leptospira santarosai TaxID=28183 RepID=UPI0024AF6DFB|nr:Mov34/MPN/PAD-1 family protein [Leptospira santarosai]MDI7218769.1 Mov34/MPN/PAD-1 family protein [Leptospira santarosai]